jgi:hypothetical protein
VSERRFGRVMVGVSGSVCLSRTFYGGTVDPGHVARYVFSLDAWGGGVPKPHQLEVISGICTKSHGQKRNRGHGVVM